MSFDSKSLIFDFKEKKNKKSVESSLNSTLSSITPISKKKVSFSKTEFIKVESYKKYNKIYNKRGIILEDEEERLCQCQCSIF